MSQTGRRIFGQGERLRIKPCFHTEILSPEGVYLLSEHGHVVLGGDLNCRLAPLLDGTYTADEIVDLMDGQASPAEVYYSLALMEKKGYIEEGEAGIDSQHEAFWHSLNLKPGDAERRLRNTTFSVISFGAVSVLPLLSALADLGIRIDEPGDFALVLTDDYLQRGLRDFNASALESGRPWLLAKPIGTILWVGPVFWPGKTACWECMAQRIRANREVESYLQRRLATDTPFLVSLAALPSTVQIGVQLATMEAAKWIARGEEQLSESRLITLDTLTMKMAHHILVRRPQCPSCGHWEHQAVGDPVPLTLQSRKKRFTADGGHRIARPQETIQRYSYHVSPFIGAVTELVRVPTPDDDLLHVYSAGHNFAIRNWSLHFLRQGLRSKSAGKGATDAQAKASALGEALERYSGIFQGTELRTRRSYRELGASAIHPNACMLFSDQQFQHRDDWNARALRFQVVPVPFDVHAEIEWTPVWSLTQKEFKYLPTGYLYYGYPQEQHKFFYWPDSNGNAAGNSLEEAILQGFMELVERDSVCLWWYNRVRRPSVDIDSFDDPYISATQRLYEELDRPIWVLDIMSDLNIPVFVAISRRTDKEVEDIILAFGAHFDPKVALRRAITELNQFLPAVLPIGRDGSGEYAFPDAESQHWWKTATLANQPYLAPDSALPPRRRADFSAIWSNDLRDDVLACQETVERRGMEMLVLDQTRPDIELPVVKVIVPGMRHFWARFAPGRLYDVPMELGWLPEPLPENQLNPTPLFL